MICTEQELIKFPRHPCQLDLGERRKLTLVPYQYEWVSKDGIRHRLTIPREFRHNGASVPRLVWSFYPPHPLDRAAPGHDLLYQRGGVLRPGEHTALVDGRWLDVGKPWTRHAADRWFYARLGEDPKGPNWFYRRAAYDVVWIGGGGSWQAVSEDS